MALVTEKLCGTNDIKELHIWHYQIDLSNYSLNLNQWTATNSQWLFTESSSYKSFTENQWNSTDESEK